MGGVSAATPRRLSGGSFSRRRFTEASTPFVIAFARPAVPEVAVGPILPPPPAEPEPSLIRTLRRRDDLLSLRLELFNLRFEPGAATPRLVAIVPSLPAVIVAVFPPQHVGEEVFSQADVVPPPGEVRTLLARESRLAFTVPPSRLPLEAAVDRLLDWEALSLRVVPAAGGAPLPGLLGNLVNHAGSVLTSLSLPLVRVAADVLRRRVAALSAVRAPRKDETAVEIPWHLVLSPSSTGGFAHSGDVVTRGRRAELWHTRLGVRKGGAVDETDPTGRTVRAVWARDANFGLAALPEADDDGPLPTSLTPRNRHDIVRLTSDVSLAARQPVSIERLMLSALGGWLDSTGTWDPPTEISLEHWRHRATLGRDSYVRVIQRGYLFPLGHQAVEVTITERTLEQAAQGGSPGAYLRKRKFIVVRQPVKEYPAPGQPSDGRAFPFRRVHIDTLVTPDIEEEPFEPPTGGAYWPMVGNPRQPLQFALIGTDWAGRTVELTAPLAFVPSTDASNPGVTPALVDTYVGHPVDNERRRRPTGGQAVAFGPEGSPGAGDTSLEAEALSFGAEPPVNGVTEDELAAAKQAAFYPTVDRAEVRLRAVEVVRDEPVGTQTVTIAQAFVADGFGGSNPGQLLLKVEGAPVHVSFDKRSDRVGGVATPNLAVTGFTRGKGPVGGDLEVIRDNRFDPPTFFSGARLLGGVSLAEVIGPEPIPALDQAPTIRSARENELLVTELKLRWDEPLLQHDSKELFLPEDGASLALAARFKTDLEVPERSTAEVAGDLRGFAFQLLGSEAKFLVVHFARLSFRNRTGVKPDVQVEVSGVEFAGHLRFVEGLRHFLPTMGKPFSVDVHQSSVVGSLTTSLPCIAVGVFSLQNISIATAMELPFDGRPARFRFSFCSRENPFLLTVSAYSGGGHVAVECGLDEQIVLDVSLQFGASVAFNIGVASGGVEVLAGIQVAMKNGAATLGGFCRIAGEVRVLGMVSFSCHLSMALSYEEPPVDKAIGQATFHAEIDVGFFEKSVSKKVERRFGGQSDPTFAELMEPADWEAYCRAFAPIGAAS